MAEQRAIPIPKNLPAPTKVVNDFIDMLAKPQLLLHGLSLHDLLGWDDKEEDDQAERFSLIELDLPGTRKLARARVSPVTTRAWLVGSRIWRPAVLGEPGGDHRDFDFIFADQGMALDFVGKAMKMIHGHLDKDDVFEIVDNNVGGHKLRRRSDNTMLIDAWDLPIGQSIAEHIMGFQWQHEMVAIAIGARKDDVTALTRIVKPQEFEGRKRQATPVQRVVVSYDYGS